MMMGSTQQIEAVTSSLGASGRNLAACSVVTSPPSSQAQKDNRQSEMSMRFRILKSLLLVAAWISFGMNFEVIGSTLEDLKLYLNVDYHSVSFSLTLRNIGYLVMVSFSGYLFDRFPRYADLVMCLSSLLIAIPGLLIPITTVYWASAAHFFIQGVSSAFYDLGGNQMILSLWSGISHSPINLMHAGYGVGAILSVQLAKPFIKFDPMDKYRAAVSQGGVNRTLVADESSFSKQHIDLRVPYWVSAICALVISALFLVAQLGELGRKESKNINCSSIEKQEAKLLKENETIAKEKNKSQCFLKRLLFGEKLYKGASLVYMSTQIVLITVVLFCLQGFLTILSKFMLTYLTKGPARFTIDEYTNVQSIFWLLFILSRVATTFAAFRLNNSNASLWFMFILLALNTLITALLLVPAFATGAWNKLFFWLAISMIGFVVAPAHPSMFMVAKHILDDYNSFIIALFSIGLGLSSVAFQEMLGDLLDWVPPSESFLGFENFNSSYIIAHVLFIPALLAFLLFFFLIVIYRNHSHLIKN